MEYFIANIKKHSVNCWEVCSQQGRSPLIVCMEIGYYPLFMLDYAIIVAISKRDICSHCNIPETSDHYFFHCPIYSNERLQLFRDTRSLHPLNCNILLFGNSSFAYLENITIVQCIIILRTRNVSPPRFSCFVLFCFEYTFHDHPFSLIPLFFIS